MDSRSLGFVLVALGVVAVVVGLLLIGGLLRWFGNLPGDISYSGRNVKVFIPLTTMLVVSLLLSLALAVLQRLK